MKTAIIYTSWHGTTESIAQTIAEKLGSENCQIINLKKQTKINTDNYDHVILGSSIHAGNISGKMKKFISKNTLTLLQKKLGLYICCMDPNRELIQFETAFPDILRKHASAMAILGGEFKMEKMNFFERLIVKKVSGITESKSKIKTEEIEKFIHDFKN
ncbi:MAG: flavodoxin domain-containing protein [Bacteroidales bacterium]|jgi:menaquinone-dependent protoporphyrinogen oxidase|nr:flavodoxin domain-containing protein [Bacteroidales bacterium]